MFDSDSFSLVVDHQRLQLTAKQHDRTSLDAVGSVVGKYIDLLPHIPYKALGLNLLWVAKSQPGESICNIQVRVDSQDLKSSLEDHELRYGAIIYASKEPYVLKLVIEPQGENTVLHNFNYHHQIEDLPAEKAAEKAAEFARTLSSRHDESLEFLRSMYGRERRDD